MNDISSVNMSDDWRLVGGEFSVRFWFKDGLLGAEWMPRVPASKQDGALVSRASYAKVRNAFVDRVAEQTGCRIVVAELKA